jgi:type IV pilus assembly protein PilP
MRKPANKSLRAALVGGAALLGAGCVSTDMSDLENYIAEINARPARSTIQPLPELKVPETYAYQSGNAGKRDPFENFLKKRATDTEAKTQDDAKTIALRREIEGRNAEELELFELDALRMVGTLTDNNQLWGIILDKDGTVHRVRVGNYMGKNFGKILNIAEDKIELREIITTSNGGLEERPATLALSEQE